MNAAINTDQEKSKPAQRPAGLPRRLGAIFYDSLLLFALLFFASLVAVPFNITPEHIFYPLYASYIYLVCFLFFGWFWTHGGQTLGMRTWRIRVIQKSGETITWTQALTRFLGAALSWLLCGGGFVYCLFNREKLALHDVLSGTRLTRVD